MWSIMRSNKSRPDMDIFPNTHHDQTYIFFIRRAQGRCQKPPSLFLGPICNRWFRLRMRVCVIALNCFSVLQTSIVGNKKNAGRCCCFIFPISRQTSVPIGIFRIYNIFRSVWILGNKATEIQTIFLYGIIFYGLYSSLHILQVISMRTSIIMNATF